MIKNSMPVEQNLEIHISCPEAKIDIIEAD